MAVINNAVYVDGKRSADLVSLDETFEVLRNGAGCGSGCTGPNPAQIQSVASCSSLHESLGTGDDLGVWRPFCSACGRRITAHLATGRNGLPRQMLHG
jgi:hypothetical protein